MLNLTFSLIAFIFIAMFSKLAGQWIAGVVLKSPIRNIRWSIKKFWKIQCDYNNSANITGYIIGMGYVSQVFIASFLSFYYGIFLSYWLFMSMLLEMHISKKDEKN